MSKKKHRYRAFSLLQPSEMASLSNASWQNCKKTSTNPQTMEVWSKQLNVTSSWVKKWHLSSYWEAELLLTDDFLVSKICFLKLDFIDKFLKGVKKVLLWILLHAKKMKLGHAYVLCKIMTQYSGISRFCLASLQCSVVIIAEY